MNELTFKIEQRPHSPTCVVHWLIDRAGVERLATVEEVQMYAILLRYKESEEQAEKIIAEEMAHSKRRR